MYSLYKEILLFWVPPWLQPQALKGVGDDKERETTRDRQISKEAKRAERWPENSFREFIIVLLKLYEWLGRGLEVFSALLGDTTRHSVFHALCVFMI